MRKIWLLGLMTALLVAGCAVPAHWRGELTKRDIFLNLMTPEQAATFKTMEAEQKDEELLILYCQEIGVYQKWKALLPARQEVVRRGRPAEGLAPDELRMVWGAPGKIEDITDSAERSEGHKRELWSFDPKADRQGAVAFERQACFLDEKLLWFKGVRRQPSLWPRFW